MNAKVIVAIKGVRDSLNELLDALEQSQSNAVAPAEKVAPADETPKTTPAPADEDKPKTSGKSRKEREASEKLPDVNGTLTREQLDSLSYNNLKKLAKDMGISATGARDELTDKILNAKVSAPADAVSSADEEEAPAPKKTRKMAKKPEPVEEPDEDEDEDDEEVDPIVAKVNEAVEDMTNEEIADILADVGVKAKGKRQSLISAVIQAVRDGKIDLDDDDEDEDDEEEEDDSTSEDESEEEEYDVNDPENPDMTEERRTALEAYDSDTRADFESGSITRKQIVEWLDEFHGTKNSGKKKSDEELLEEYIYYSSLLINDDGEMPEEEGAYTVNGEPYCCGHPLKYNEDNETYICEMCGAEYEAGEE